MNNRSESLARGRGLSESADFAPFWAYFDDNLVTVGRLWPLAHMTVDADDRDDVFETGGALIGHDCAEEDARRG